MPENVINPIRMPALINDLGYALTFSRGLTCIYNTGRMQRAINVAPPDWATLWPDEADRHERVHHYKRGWEVVDRILKGLGPDLPPTTSHPLYAVIKRDYLQTLHILERYFVRDQGNRGEQRQLTATNN